MHLETTKLFNIREWLNTLQYIYVREHCVADVMGDVNVNVLMGPYCRKNMLQNDMNYRIY